MKNKLLPISALLLCSLACFALPVPNRGRVSAPPPVATDTIPVEETATAEPSPTPTPAPERCAVSTAVLNLRTCAAKRCTTQAWLREGALLTILSRQDAWLEVETQTGETGWVHSKFCTGEQP